LLTENLEKLKKMLNKKDEDIEKIE